MNEELFGELHEEEQYGLFGREHHKQCFLYSVSDRTSPNNRLKIEPVFDGISTSVSQYKVTDDLGSIWMIGTREECEAYLYGR
jgi:hypothetical protein